MALILDAGAHDAYEALRDFVVKYNDEHIDRIADISAVVWLQQGRVFPVMQGFNLNYHDLKASDDDL